MVMMPFFIRTLFNDCQPSFKAFFKQHRVRLGASTSGISTPPFAADFPTVLAVDLSVRSLAALALCFAATGCGSLFNEGAAAGAGVGGAAIASTITNNAAVASGIGLGALAGAQAGVKYVEKNVHRDQQNEIAAVAGPLAVGEVGHWASHHFVKLEPDEAGRVTVSRVIVSSSDLDCKEIVFSVDGMQKKVPTSAFYVATICRDGTQWKWASAEPATQRWGALQ